MLRIRLSRRGKKNQTFYRIVVAESQNKQEGKVVDVVGWYNPLQRGDKRLFVDQKLLDEWVKKGAQLSDGAKKVILSADEKKLIWPDKAPQPKEKDSDKEESQTSEPEAGN